MKKSRRVIKLGSELVEMYGRTLGRRLISVIRPFAFTIRLLSEFGWGFVFL